MKNFIECIQEVWTSIKMFFCRHNEVMLTVGERRKTIKKKNGEADVRIDIYEKVICKKCGKLLLARKTFRDLTEYEQRKYLAKSRFEKTEK